MRTILKLDLDLLHAELDNFEFLDGNKFFDLNDYQSSGQYADDVAQIVENLQNAGVETTFSTVEPLFKILCEQFFASQEEHTPCKHS